jgi:hypothetical protein
MAWDGSGDQAVLIVSEKLNKREEEWTPILHNFFIGVENNMKIKLYPQEYR